MVNLILLIHCHQPVGNFDKVFTEAFEKAYLPFIEVLEKHPGIKVNLHYSGSLLDWLVSHRPEFIDKIRSLTKKGQVEIFGGGYYEPILTLIPENDALGQIELLRLKIKELFSFEVKGGWIAERVWEPKLPKILAKAKIEYGVVDDSHFRFAGKEPESLNGYYITEEEGFKFNLFPGSEKLRYLLPFKLPQETLDYLRSREKNSGANSTITFGDDGEKFGLWPGTHKWVYQENWLDNFFKALEENSSWINLLTFSEYVSQNPPSARVYLPCASYSEMMQWSEGFYRNFMVKYPEANNMHKKMLLISNKINLFESQLKRQEIPIFEQAKRHLYMAQANDSYWHGVFGGFYLNHLRLAVYHNLIEAENLIDKIDGRDTEEVEFRDFDCDAKEEILLNTKNFSLCLRPELGASLSELSYKPRAVNLVNTISRKEEKYHKKIAQLIAKKDELESLNSGSQPASIHNFTKVKDENLDKILFYDKQPRYCLLERFLSEDVTIHDFIACNYKETADFSESAYLAENKSTEKETKIVFNRQADVNGNSLKLTKAITPKNHSLILDYLLENLEEKINLEATFGMEFNFSSFNEEYSRPVDIRGINEFILNDSWNSLKVEFILKEKANLWVFPVETVSESETGIEKSCQELCLFFWWKINLAAKSKWQQNLKINIIA